jgi:hypothetical protein
VSYDHWKATNPSDEWLGPEPPPYDAADDFAKSLEFAYAAVRQHIANGGRPWTPKNLTDLYSPARRDFPTTGEALRTSAPA